MPLSDLRYSVFILVKFIRAPIYFRSRTSLGNDPNFRPVIYIFIFHTTCFIVITVAPWTRKMQMTGKIDEFKALTKQTETSMYTP